MLGAASPEPSAAPPGANTWCPIGVTVIPLDERRVAIGFSTPMPTGRASGTVRLIANGARYDVHFDDAVVLHRGARPGAGGPVPVPVVVRFPAPVRVSSAVVTSLDNPTPGPCHPLYAPWTPALTPWLPPAYEAGNFASTYSAHAAEAPVRDAPAPLPYTPPACANRFMPAKTLRAFEPYEIPGFNGIVNVLVTVGTDGKAIAVEVPFPSRSEAADARSKDAAARSLYSPQIFDCEKIIGTYMFTVEFSSTGK